jgi:hypothetical protein
MAIEKLDALGWLVQRVNAGDNDALQVLANIAEEVLSDREQAFQQQVQTLLSWLIRFEINRIVQSDAVYLRLPRQLAHFEQDSLFLSARPLGRLWYRVDQYTLDDEGLEVVRFPHRYTRQAIFQQIDAIIRIADVQLHLAIPLSYRIGEVVGWLSALSISQPDDAQAGMVLLASLVSPLVSGLSGDKVQHAARSVRRLRPGCK